MAEEKKEESKIMESNSKTNSLFEQLKKEIEMKKKGIRPNSLEEMNKQFFRQNKNLPPGPKDEEIINDDGKSPLPNPRIEYLMKLGIRDPRLINSIEINPDKTGVTIPTQTGDGPK